MFISSWLLLTFLFTGRCVCVHVYTNFQMYLLAPFFGVKIGVASLRVSHP